MGLDFGKPSQTPELEIVSVQGQEEYPQYDITADRQQMSCLLYTSPSPRD